MANFTRIGYGQVEPNQLSAQKTGQIYASLALAKDVNVLQNGEFMFYDYVTNSVCADDSTGVAEPMLVFNEVKIYEDHLSYKDFAMVRVGDNYVTNRPAVGTITTANYDGTVYGEVQKSIQLIQNMVIEWMDLLQDYSKQILEISTQQTWLKLVLNMQLVIY